MNFSEDFLHPEWNMNGDNSIQENMLRSTMENNIIKCITHRYIYSEIILRAGQKQNSKANHNRKNAWGTLQTQ